MPTHMHACTLHSRTIYIHTASAMWPPSTPSSALLLLAACLLALSVAPAAADLSWQVPASSKAEAKLRSAGLGIGPEGKASSTIESQVISILGP